MTEPEIAKMILWGATGQARVLRECMAAHGVSLVAIFDNNSRTVSPFADIPIRHGTAGFEEWLSREPSPSSVGFLIAIGGENGPARIELQRMLRGRGLTPLTARHRTAFIAPSASLGVGAQILAHATICVDVRIGESVIVNTGASVDHECEVGDGAHICPGARLAGGVVVGTCVTVGTGAIILPRVRIGDGAVVGAGAVVLRDVGAREVVVGNPARVVGTRR
jgi:sugar O-acyltransferase (sialic acid O-acetyltransferase NeuD family)